MNDRLYFRQLLAGRDFAKADPIARQMVNFTYFVGDRVTGEALVIDPAYSVADLQGLLEADNMRCAGALVTHYHADHCGGHMMGFDIEGAAELVSLTNSPVHIQRSESEWIRKTTQLGADDLVEHDSGDEVTVGEVAVKLIHTPGHTPGSQCFMVDKMLISGDTLFLEGCGRTDLPGGDAADLYLSLTQRLSKVPDDAILFPGHMYSEAPSQSMGETRKWNFVFRPKTESEWLRMFS